MGREQTAEEILELRADAAAARKLATTFDHGPSVTDLLNYAVALDRQANELELALSPEEVGPSPEVGFEIACHRTAREPLSRARFR